MPLNAVLRETDIRPESLMQGRAEALAGDIQRLLQYKDDFVDVPCPACGSEDASKAFEKCGLTYLLCSDCETMYISPRPTPEILENYYSTSESYRYWNEYVFPASEEARREMIFYPRACRVVDICYRSSIECGTLLEAGAGFGTFCEEIQRLGIFRRVIAVEPNPYLAKTCRSKGLEVIEKPIEQVRLNDDTVNVVVSFEVIEHLFSPRDFLLSCVSILPPGGLMVITCPNVKGFDIAILQSLSSTISIEHLNYFHINSLSHLIEECGFEILEALTPGKLDAELVRKEILASKLDVSLRPFLKRVLVDDWKEIGGKFQQFLADNLLSSHMWLVARKMA